MWAITVKAREKDEAKLVFPSTTFWAISAVGFGGFRSGHVGQGGSEVIYSACRHLFCSLKGFSVWWGNIQINSTLQCNVIRSCGVAWRGGHIWMSLGRWTAALWEEIMAFLTEDTEPTKPLNVKQRDGPREEGSRNIYLSHFQFCSF